MKTILTSLSLLLLLSGSSQVVTKSDTIDISGINSGRVVTAKDINDAVLPAIGKTVKNFRKGDSLFRANGKDTSLVADLTNLKTDVSKVTGAATSASVTLASNAAATASSQAQAAQTTANAAAASASNNSSLITGNTNAITDVSNRVAVQGQAISRDSALVVAQKKSADSLLAVVIALKTTSTATTAALATQKVSADSLLAVFTTLNTLAKKQVTTNFLSSGKDSIVVGSSNTAVLYNFSGTKTFAANTLDSTKTIIYEQSGYYTGAGLSVTGTINFNMNIGTGGVVFDNVVLVPLLATTQREVTVYAEISFVYVNATSVQPIATGYVLYGTATLDQIQRKRFIAKLGTLINTTVANDFAVSASISSGSLVMKKVSNLQQNSK